jgi:signal transduction histidine kinase
LNSTFQPTPLSEQDFTEVIRRADILQRIMTLISGSLALEPLLSNILDSAVSLIQATHGTIGLVVKRNDGLVIRTVAVYNMPDEEVGAEMRPGVGLAGTVLQQASTILLERYGDLNQPTLPELSEHSVIGVPIRWGEEMIGFFGIGGAPPYRFTTHDVKALELFAQYAAIAIHNVNLFEASQHALEQMRLLYETSQRIGLAGDVDEVIAAYLDQIAVHGQYICNVCLYSFDAQGQRTEVVVRGRWTPGGGSQRLEERMPYSRDNLDPLLDAGQTVTIADVRTERVPAELRRMQEESGRLALAMIPLIVRGQRIGLVVLSYLGVHQWDEAGLWPYQATAAQLATALDSRMQQELLYERGQQLAVLEERQRLARELHDSVTQLIFSNTLIAQSIAPAWKRDPLEGQRRVDRLLELSQTALREMRSLLFELHPIRKVQGKGELSALTGSERVRRYGLLPALRLLASDFSRDGIQVGVSARGYREGRPASEAGGGDNPQVMLEESIYRISQEALNNAIKHARARQIFIRLENGKSQGLCLFIKDDGVGFVPGARGGAEETKASGFGMHTMRERAVALGGSLQIISAPGKGTTVEVTIPFKEAVA